MLSAQNIAFGYTGQVLYEKSSFIIGRGQKVGLVGPNGAGKSTLMKLIRGEESALDGKLEISGTVGYVPQEVKDDPILDTSETVLDYIDPNRTQEDFEIKRLFVGLELKTDLTRSPKNLSGGQKTRLAIARALIAKPDILLLDEPTNFMDTKGTTWVMNFLANYDGTVICISHDLKLMDHAINKILYVNPATKRVEEYKGNYSSYLVQKEERDNQLKKEIVEQQKKIKRMQEGYSRMKRLTGKGIRARVKQREKIKEAIESLPSLPPELRSIKITLPEPERVGALPIQANNISKKYGEKQILKNVNFVIHRGERIALIGPNGVGKSTFIKVLMGMIEPDSGVIRKDERLSVGYYSQEFETMDLSMTVLNAFIHEVECSDSLARGFLGKFMLSGDKIFQTVRSLSGGEKTRLSIAILTAKNHNMLILDEPTTYLDVLSQRIILEALKDYKGAMLLVSHTPEFVKELAPQNALTFPEEKLTYWRDELLDKVEEM